MDIPLEEYALKIEGLTKIYKAKQQPAVDNLSFYVKPNEIVGLLGHNGAGKSTVIKSITGVLPFEKGKIQVYGKDNVKDSILAKKMIGYVSDNHAVFQRMTGYEYIMFMADIYGVPKDKRTAIFDEIEKVFNLKDDVYKEISTYSHGMKQKICMMGSLIHSPKLWILDEPLIGLDPRISKNVIEYMQSYVKKGNAILFSSHNIDAVKKICDRLVIIKKGKIAADLVVDEINKDSSFNLEEFFLDENSTLI